MLKPDDNRLNYSDLLTPPAGYEVEFALGTIYTLDLEALVGVPLSLGLSEEMDRTIMDDPIYVLEGLRKSADKFAIFCEGGQIKVPRENNSIFALMENSVFEVSLANGKSFHPKLWLIKYRNEDGEALYRLLVLTRNMTFDRSWDIAIALEGQKVSEQTAKNRPLADLLQFLTRYSTNHEKVRKIHQLMSDLKYVQFDPVQKQISDFEFCPIGIDGYEKASTGVFDTFHKLIVISPFISESTIRELHEKTLTGSKYNTPERVLITRKTELHKLSPELMAEFEVYTLKDSVVDGESAISGENESDEIAQLQDIHAKLYAKSKYNHHLIYVGSANCSRNAFHGNVEFLLKLTYRKRGFQIMHLLDDLFGEDDDNPFERIEELPAKKEDESDVIEQLQKGIKQLCRSQLNATVLQEDNAYAVEITVADFHGDEAIEFTVGPLLSTATEVLQITTLINGLSMLELGHFYKIRAEKNGESIERVIKIDTTDVPEEREHEIFRSIIKDSYTFLRYIAFLLADDFLMAALENLEKQHSGFGSWDVQDSDHPVIYENMLKTAAHSPEKLEDIENMIRMIEDDSIVPPEFNQLYQTFIPHITGSKTPTSKVPSIQRSLGGGSNSP
ncbi:phospholipase D family protein [Lentibacillus salinarum]|uniref:Phospholipase D family protein n=1 Tax=Lentibacillus salinarum TaxID=446820 RepID=A0ABW3ZSW6_9BACI